MKADPAMLRRLFKKDAIEEIPEETLSGLIARYPFFPHLHWLQAARNKNDKSIVQRSALYAFYPRRFLHFVHPPADEKQQSSGKQKKASTPQKPVLQPLYTEDYFAYTRTRLPEHIENDKPPTMEQVRSFTGWLRMMKKPQPGLPTESDNPDLSPDESENEKSPNKEQVVTESMAKIWVEHGHTDKAIAIYNKLILLNPEKKGYFAAKISALKEQ